MIEFSIEVRNGAARFDVAVRAESVESVERALEVAGRIHPAGKAARVKFPAVLERSLLGTAHPQRLAA